MHNVFSLGSLVNALTMVEPLLTVFVLAAFLRAKSQGRFPALRNFLLLRVASDVALMALWYAPRFGVDVHTAYFGYFYVYYGSYLAAAVAIYFVIQEMFRDVMAPLPGLRRLGLIAFRWAATISMIVAVASAAMPSGVKGRKIIATGMELVRCISIMELCLLSLLVFCLYSLGLSFRSRAFGVGLGLGFMALMDFLTAVLAYGHKSMNSSSTAITGVLSAVGLLAWAGYFLVPEPARKAVTLPMSSPLMRWNEIAMALGHASPQVAVGPSSQFFLQDVEKVVDKMLTKNAMNSAN